MRENDKSFADDLVESGYCKCESILVIRSTEIFPALLRFVLPAIELFDFENGFDSHDFPRLGGRCPDPGCVTVI